MNTANTTTNTAAPPDDDRPVPPLPAIEPGIYQHYKGPRYRVLGISRHSETLEALVVYHPLAGDQAWWVRPWTMFTETVTIDGRTLPRFRKVE